MANGASRIVLANAKLKNATQEEINKAFANENEVAKSTQEIPSRSAIEHNHKADNLHKRK